MHPEAFQKQNFRTNLSAALIPKFDLNVERRILEHQPAPAAGRQQHLSAFIYSALNNPGFNHNGLGYTETGSLGEYRNGYGGYSPAQIFQQLSAERHAALHRLGRRQLASARLDAEPGHGRRRPRQQRLLQPLPVRRVPELRRRFAWARSDTQTNFRNFSAKLVSNSTWQARSYLNLKTTVGADYMNLETDGVSDGGTNLPPGAQTVQAAMQDGGDNDNLQTVNKTLGLYVAGTGVVPRSHVPHGRRAHGPEQLVRHQVPARRLSEGEPLVDHLGRELLPAILTG